MSSKIKQLIFLQVLTAFLVAMVSCNAKTTEDEEEIAVTPALVAVKNFYLKANDSVMSKLDSVSFSIDLNTGVIFNADSLPKGTDVTRLIPSITFANAMTKAELVFLKDNTEETTSDYLKNPEDSIDFTYPVKLDVTAQDGFNTFEYTIKVNVHKVKGDTIIWDKLATSPFPSKNPSPVAQKTTYRNHVAYSMVEESNGDYTLSTCSDLNTGEWELQDLSLEFTPMMESFNATDSEFYILSETGDLYSSEDALTWTPTGEENWISILGVYGNSILGISLIDEIYHHSQFPAPDGFTPNEIEKDFPVKGSSIIGLMETEWADNPTAFLACGENEFGESQSAVWAYDGNVWAIINHKSLPAVSYPMMARYVVYRDTPYIFTQRELDIWILFGGTLQDGEMNKDVYISYDNGVNWSLAPSMMQLPENFPVLSQADLITAGYNLSADIADAWNPESSGGSHDTRAGYTIEGTEITWICPYLYIFGGYNKEGALSEEIWRGVLTRLTFMPII